MKKSSKKSSKKKMKKKMPNTERKIRYAVIGLGHIAQAAVLPAFQHAKNSELVALISGDDQKLTQLSKMYNVPEDNLFTYSEFPECLAQLDVDVVYIALPNHLHLEACLASIDMGCHVLCEKPLALSVRDCREIESAADSAGVKFMTAYRLHFEKANLEAVKLAAEKNKLGDLRLFNSTFTFQVKDPQNIRLNPTYLGGGPVWDIGIYCINAVRMLFRDEPIEIFAMAENNGDERFVLTDEMVSVMMRFPDNRLANFICSFGADACASYEVIGTKGSIRVDNAYEYVEERELGQYKEGKTVQERTFKKSDQFAAELIYFSDCVKTGEDPEPSAEEGIADIRIIEGILRSIQLGRPVRLITPSDRLRYPQSDQLIQRPPVRKPRTVNVHSPSGD